MVLISGAALACGDQEIKLGKKQETVKPEKKKILREAYIMTGKEHKICHAFLKGFRERKLTKIHFCGLPLPRNDPDFKTIDWQQVNPLDHLDIVRHMVIRASFRRSNMGNDFVTIRKRNIRFFNTIGYPEVEVQRYWTPYKPDIMKMIKAKEVLMWVTNIDADHNGQKEPLYRMTQIWVSGGGDPKDDLWQDKESDRRQYYVGKGASQCWESGVKRPRDVYLYYMSKKHSIAGDRFFYTSGATHDNWLKIFSWKDRIYYLAGNRAIYKSKLLHRNSLVKPQTAFTYGFWNVCNFATSRAISNK
jgi:hypothetical protein